jgi:hypothetical protein
MNGDTAKQLRNLLLAHPDGLEIWDIARALGREYTNVAKRLHATYGCYVMRWNGQRQVWACVPEPVNAPRPPYVRKPYVPYKPERLTKMATAATRAGKAEPITQDVLDAATRKGSTKVIRAGGACPAARQHIPQKTVWVPVAPWPTQESL